VEEWNKHVIAEKIAKTLSTQLEREEIKKTKEEILQKNINPTDSQAPMTVRYFWMKVSALLLLGIIFTIMILLCYYIISLK